ncbi:MAG: HNH endonuclease signature motif containing protein [Kofleriaceae bacterium]
MLREEAVETRARDARRFEQPTGAPEGAPKAAGSIDWQSVDRELRRIAVCRAGLDAEEMRWLREAEALQIWREYGMVSALDYMERVLHYGPRAAQDRLRVARALGTLPVLTAALAHGELSFSAVRELTRVATPTTEAKWRQAAVGKNLRQIEELVAERRPGDNPDDPGDPKVRTRVVRFELAPETFAMLRQAQQALDEAHGHRMSDDEVVAALCNAVLEQAPAAERSGRAKFQIAVVVCERCGQGWQEGGGATLAISPAAVERACCDAQHIGSIDGAAPERAYQDIPPSVARFVRRRDRGRCRVPGCRSTRGLELHHLVRRADGGSHDASNIVLICSACHQSHHDSRLMITGTAAEIEAHRDGAHVGANVATESDSMIGKEDGDTTDKLDFAKQRTQANDALVRMGWKPKEAHAAIAMASATVAPHATLEAWIREALRHCRSCARSVE